MNEKKAQALSLYRTGNHTFSSIGRELGVHRSTVSDWVKTESTYTQAIPFTNDNLTRIKETPKIEDIDEFLSSLAPININIAKPSTTTQPCGDYAMVIGDMHFGHECEKTLNIFFETVRQLNPHTIILNGDTLDMTSISKYPKDIRLNTSLLNERIAYQKFLATLRSISPYSHVFETNANHSGDGVEGRWWRYLSDRLGELRSLPDIAQKLSYENVFLDPKFNVELVDYVELPGGLFVMHGDVVRKHGGYSARGLLEKWFTSIIGNHTHRVGMTSQRIPSIGNRPDQIITVYENGCACSLTPIYASAPNWQNSFCIVSTDSENDIYSVEQVIIQGDKANVSTLGTTIVA
jgi:transposase-like protein